MPVNTWQYRDEAESVRHLGPVAQDFHDAFGLGSSEKVIATVDADGVALAALQGLNSKLESAVAALQDELSLLRSQLVLMASGAIGQDARTKT